MINFYYFFPKICCWKYPWIADTGHPASWTDRMLRMCNLLSVISSLTCSWFLLIWSIRTRVYAPAVETLAVFILYCWARFKLCSSRVLFLGDACWKAEGYCSIWHLVSNLDNQKTEIFWKRGRFCWLLSPACTFPFLKGLTATPWLIEFEWHCTSRAIHVCQWNGYSPSVPDCDEHIQFFIYCIDFRCDTTP